MKKYIVRPGHVISRNDGDRHFVSSSQLMRLHGVHPSECIVVSNKEDRFKLRAFDSSKMINLFPRYDGKYKLYNKTLDPTRKAGRLS